MNSEYTPGPWHIGARGVIGEHAIYVPGEPVTMIGYASGRNVEANAQLMAAAPDMLAALIRLADYMAAAGVPEDAESQYEQACEAISIAKRGREA